MIEPDLYINQYYQLNYANTVNCISNKYTNLYFGLTLNRKLDSIQIDIFIRIDFIIREYINYILMMIKELISYMQISY